MDTLMCKRRLMRRAPKVLTTCSKSPRSRSPAAPVRPAPRPPARERKGKHSRHQKPGEPVPNISFVQLYREACQHSRPSYNPSVTTAGGDTGPAGGVPRARVIFELPYAAPPLTLN